MPQIKYKSRDELEKENKELRRLVKELNTKLMQMVAGVHILRKSKK